WAISVASRHWAESAQAVAVQDHRGRFPATDIRCARRLAHLGSTALSRVSRDPICMGNHELDHELSIREDRAAGSAKTTNRPVFSSATAFPQISRRTTLRRLQFSRRLRFAVDPNNL